MIVSNESAGAWAPTSGEREQVTEGYGDTHLFLSASISLVASWMAVHGYTCAQTAEHTDNKHGRTTAVNVEFSL